MTFLRKNTKQSTTTKPAAPAITSVTDLNEVSKQLAALTEIVASLTAKPSVLAATTTPTAKPSKKPATTTTKVAPTAKPSKKPATVKASTKSTKHPAVPKFADCCAVSLGADKDTEVSFENAALIAEALRANHADREWTAIGGLKTAVRQMLRASGTLNPTTLDTAWKAVRGEARKQGFSA